MRYPVRKSMSYEEIQNLRYEIKNEYLKKWSMKYGIIDTTTNVLHCVMSGGGFMGELYLHPCDISREDAAIFDKVLVFLAKNNLRKR